jgi:hypothetical protein
MHFTAYDLQCIISDVAWEVVLHEQFEPEFDALPEQVQDEPIAHAKLLGQFGPQLVRPRVDTLKGSRHANMKELRFDAADGIWRFAFAFDPKRKAIVCAAGTSPASVKGDSTVV